MNVRSFELFFALQKELEPTLRAGDLRACDQRIAEVLRSLAPTPFHTVANLHFTNSPQEIAREFDEFIRSERGEKEILAAYTETNGFDINPHRWHFSFFGYDRYGGTTDFDWLGNFICKGRKIVLTGMESLQEVYGSDAFDHDRFGEAIYIANLMVVSRFQLLIAEASKWMKELRFPLLSTSHEFDYIAEVRPGS